MSFESAAPWQSSFNRADELLRSGEFRAAADLYRSITNIESHGVGTPARAVTAIAKNRLGLCEAMGGRFDQAESLFFEVDTLFYVDVDESDMVGPTADYVVATLRHLQAERAVVLKGVSPDGVVDEISICEHGCPIPWPPPCGLDAGHCR
jgi:hypothetical protein